MNDWKAKLRTLFFDDTDITKNDKDPEEVFYEKLEAFVLEVSKDAYIQGGNDAVKAMGRNERCDIKYEVKK